MAWICASGMGTLLRKPSRAPLMVLSGELCAAARTRRCHASTHNKYAKRVRSA